MVMSRFTQRPQRQTGTGARQGQRPIHIATPSRDAGDAKCANCNQAGHIAQQCTRPKLATDQRRCHTCNKQGHLSRQCPDKDKAARANVVAQSQGATGTSAAQEKVAFFWVIEGDFNGGPPARWAQRRATTFGDLPVQEPRTTQRERREARCSTSTPQHLGLGLSNAYH